MSRRNDASPTGGGTASGSPAPVDLPLRLGADWTQPRPPQIVVPLLTVGTQFGVAPGVVLGGTGVTEQDLTDPKHRVSGAHEVQMVRNLCAALPHVEHLGLLVSRAAGTATAGCLGYAWLSASTLRQASTATFRFHRLTCGMTSRTVDRQNGDHVVTLEADHLPADVRDFYLQRELGQYAVIVQELFQETVPVRTTLPRPPFSAPDAQQTWLEMFGVSPTFDADRTSYRLGLELLEQPLPRAAPFSFAQFISACEHEMEDLAAPDAFAMNVRVTIGNLPPNLWTLEEVARHMALSPRTLRRQLQSEGTTFRDLIDSIRAGQAEELLLHTDLSMGQIALRLGYENPPAFSTAFRRWYATTPSAFRARQSSGPGPGTDR